MKRLLVILSLLLAINVFAMGPKEVVSQIEQNFIGYKVSVVDVLRTGVYVIKMEKGSQKSFLVTDGEYLYPNAFNIMSKENVISKYQLRDTAYDIDLSKLTKVSSGQGDRKLIIVTDFECPYCRRSHTLFETKIKQMFPNGIETYVVNFPLSFHKKADLFARIFLAGMEQNVNLMKYLFSENTTTSDDAIIERYAKVLHKNKDEFKQLLYSQEISNKLQSDLQLVQKLGVSGTPTFFINGSKNPNKFYMVRNGDSNFFKYLKEGVK